MSVTSSLDDFSAGLHNVFFCSTDLFSFEKQQVNSRFLLFFRFGRFQLLLVREFVEISGSRKKYVGRSSYSASSWFQYGPDTVTSSFAMSRCGECPASIQIEINLVVQHVQVVFEMTTCTITEERKQLMSLSQEFTRRFDPPGSAGIEKVFSMFSFQRQTSRKKTTHLT